MTLLCVDDDIEDTELLLEAIAVVDDSCTCLTATDGIEALRILRTVVPDHIILDVNMPGMDGRETLARIRTTAATKAIPVHILSTTQSVKEIESLKKTGATSFLTKPNSFEELCEFVRYVLKSGGKR